ncbi:MAG: ABC transporter permease [Rhodothermales bacterium]
MWEKIVYNFLISAEALVHNKTRSLLTSLGIIFGVASVIAMLAIGSGAQQEILRQIRLLGATNIIVTPVTEQTEGGVTDDASTEDDASEEEGESRSPYTPGLTLADAQSISALVPGVKAVSPEVVVETNALRAGYQRSIKLVGVDRAYFDDGGLELSEGMGFTDQQMLDSSPVAIIGHDVRTRFFAGENPIGKRIKCGTLWLTVVGVMGERNVDSQNLERLGIRNYDLDIYSPISTVLLRYENRALVNKELIQDAERDRRRNRFEVGNYHQLDRLVIRVDEAEQMRPVADVVQRMLARRHFGVVDFEVIIPEALMQQERRTQTIFNVVLAAIASISLIVGGIGIMNIMLASVMERIREIGVRRAIGATRQDVILQFLIEAMTISFAGGIIGIILGVSMSLIIEQTADIETQITWWSVLLSFAVSVSIGLIFGLLPAKRAAEHDPVYALRHE